jgi:hypothetical protein
VNKTLLTALAILIFALPIRAQSRAEIGIHSAGDGDRGYKNTLVGISGRGVFRFGSMALDGTVDWTFRAPKTGAAPDGKTLTTSFLLRRYVFGGVYVVGGVDVNKLSSVLLDATATSAATGVGAEIGEFRLQGVYEPPDFTSGQSLSHYRVEAEYVKTLGKKHYVSLRPQATLVRFDRESKGTLTAERVGLTISFGRFF